MLLSSIYNFKDYRQFLREFYNFQKAQDASYSFKKFSLKAKIGSPNLLKLVMDGDKNLSTTSIIKFAKGLSLDADETSFFETLVLENQATDLEEKRYYGKRLRSHKREGKKGVFNISGKTTLFDKTLMPALIVYLAECPIDNLEKIKTILPILNSELNEMVRSLEEEKILSRNDNKFTIDFDHAIFHRKPSDIKLKNFLRSQLALSVKSFDKTYESGGKYFSHSMGISKEQFEKIIEKIKKTISEINLNYSYEPADDVVQINIQAFTYSSLIK